MIRNAIWSCSVKSKTEGTELDKYNLGSTGLITRLDSLELSPIKVDSSPILWLQKRILLDIGAEFTIPVAYDYKKNYKDRFLCVYSCQKGLYRLFQSEMCIITRTFHEDT